jgi:manganese/zinc/iron transport system permease protein
MTAADVLRLDLVPLLTGVLAAVACAIPGVFLLLRRQALIGDAMAHVALPGIVVAFLLTGSAAAWPMMLGAGAAAVLAALLIEAIRRWGAVEPGAAMGVTFTALFALGVLLLEQADLGRVHLDVEHALYGSLETLVWFDAQGLGSLADPAALAGLPPQLPRLAVIVAALAVATRLAWRPLALSTFDPVHAAAVGVPVGAVAAGLSVASAAAAVGAFDAVGAIIAIAMFVCPPAAARLCTDRLGAMLALAIGFAALAALLGYALAAWAPLALGAAGGLSAAGMIATMAGAILALAAAFGPARRRAAAV